MRYTGRLEEERRKIFASIESMGKGGKLRGRSKSKSFSSGKHKSSPSRKKSSSPKKAKSPKRTKSPTRVKSPKHAKSTKKDKSPKRDKLQKHEKHPKREKSPSKHKRPPPARAHSSATAPPPKKLKSLDYEGGQLGEPGEHTSQKGGTGKFGTGLTDAADTLATVMADIGRAAVDKLRS